MDPILHLVEQNKSCCLFCFFTVYMTCIAVWADAKVTNLLLLSRLVMISLALASKGEVPQLNHECME